MRAKSSLEIKRQWEMKISMINLRPRMIIRQKTVMYLSRTWSLLTQQSSTFNYAHPLLPRHILWCQSLFNPVGSILCLQTFLKLLFHPNNEILSFCLFCQGFAHCLLKKLTTLNKCIRKMGWTYQFLSS